jgi:predicted DNA binding CopG/RHH family protein
MDDHHQVVTVNILKNGLFGKRRFKKTLSVVQEEVEESEADIYDMNDKQRSLHDYSLQQLQTLSMINHLQTKSVVSARYL